VRTLEQTLGVRTVSCKQSLSKSGQCICYTLLKQMILCLLQKKKETKMVGDEKVSIDF